MKLLRVSNKKLINIDKIQNVYVDKFDEVCVMFGSYSGNSESFGMTKEKYSDFINALNTFYKSDLVGIYSIDELLEIRKALK